MKILFTPESKKMIFFDIHRTLVDDRGAFEESFVDVLQQFTARWDDGGEKPTPADTFKIYTKEWDKRAKSTLSANEKRKHCLALAMQPYPFAITDHFTKTFFSKIEELKRLYAKLVPDASETLDTLSQSYGLSIISNGGRAKIEAQLKGLELERYFPSNHLFTLQGKDIRKPKPAIFQQALKQTGLSPAQAVMVGNSWRNDIFGSTRSGIDAVWYNPGHKLKWTEKRIGKEQVIVIKKFKQLLDIFAH